MRKTSVGPVVWLPLLAALAGVAAVSIAGDPVANSAGLLIASAGAIGLAIVLTGIGVTIHFLDQRDQAALEARMDADLRHADRALAAANALLDDLDGRRSAPSEYS